MRCGHVSWAGERKSSINPELWHACAGPLVSLPPVGSYVVYFPQGHSEQVTTIVRRPGQSRYPRIPKPIHFPHLLFLLSCTVVG